MTEIWKDVVGYEDYFQISNTGKLFSKRTNKILSQCLHKNGYYIHTTRIGGRSGKCKSFKIHILVATAFIDNPENKPTVNHIDGNKINNHVDNLEWSTHKEQSRHAVDTGLITIKSGVDTYNAKLSADDVKYIRENYIKGDSTFGTRGLGNRFGIHHTKISKVVRNISYKNVK